MIKIKLSPSEWLKIAVLFVVFVGGSIASYVVLQPKRVLPIYNPSDLNPAVVDDDLERKGRGHRIGDFELLYYPTLFLSKPHPLFVAFVKA